MQICVPFNFQSVKKRYQLAYLITVAKAVIVPLVMGLAWLALGVGMARAGNHFFSSNPYALQANLSLDANYQSQQAQLDDALTNTVVNVDVKQYMGTWFEIARLPMYFQRACAKDVTATYGLNQDGSIKVVNACVKKDNTVMTAIARAVSVNNNNTHLKVSFLPEWLRWFSLADADYHILRLDENYQVALVGTPDKDYLWLLSREPMLNDAVIGSYLATAKGLGYDIGRLIYTKQSAKDIVNSQYITLMP